MKQTERLRLIREKLGFTEAQFAEKMFYEPRSYHNIESGSDDIRPKFMQRLQKIFDVNPEFLLTGEGDMFLNIKDDIVNNDNSNSLNINSISDTMTNNTLDKLLDIILKQRDDIRYSLETQRILANKLPNMESINLGGVRGEAV